LNLPGAAYKFLGFDFTSIDEERGRPHVSRRANMREEQDGARRRGHKEWPAKAAICSG